jgi:hypothetical protein
MCWSMFCAVPRAEQALLEQAIADALRETPRLLAGQWERATQALHSRRVESSGISFR